MEQLIRLEEAANIIANIQDQMRNVSLEEPNFPFFENPLLPSAQETPVTPNTLNLPGIDSNLISNTVNNSNFKQLEYCTKTCYTFWTEINYGNRT